MVLDAHTVRGVLDATVLDGDILNNVVRTSTDRADGDSVSTGARSASERDVLEFIALVRGKPLKGP